MANTAATLRAIVQRRVRDVNGTMHLNADVIDLLSRSQRLVNAGAQIVLKAGTLTTAKQRLIYELDQTDFTDAVDAIRVRDGGHDLEEFKTIEELKAFDSQWFRAIGNDFQAFCRIGRTLLIVYPAKNFASSVTVVYSKLATTLSADGTSLEIETDRDVLVSDLTEIMLLLRQRDLVQAQDAMKRYGPRFMASRRVKGELPE